MEEVEADSTSIAVPYEGKMALEAISVGTGKEAKVRQQLRFKVGLSQTVATVVEGLPDSFLS